MTPPSSGLRPGRGPFLPFAAFICTLSLVGHMPKYSPPSGGITSAQAISAVEGEASLDLTGDVTLASGESFKATRLLTVAVSANTTLSEASHAGRYIFVTGTSRVITLPDNQGAGVHFTLLSNDANGFTLRTGTSGITGDNMNGSQADITVDARNGVTCISTGTDYVVLGA